MSKTKNIGGIIDAHYRYKRPEIKVKEELRGTNGQRTVIENIEEVSKALHVPPNYPIQFLGYELSVSARFQEKTKAGGRTCAVFSGIHSHDVLENLLTKFERIYIVCPTCKDAGTRLSVSQKSGVRIKCGACGKVSPPKTAHKTEKFMEKHPPPKQRSGLSVDREEEENKEAPAAEEPARGGKKKRPKERSKDDPPAEEQDEKEQPQTPQEKIKEFLRRKGIEGPVSGVQVVELLSELDRVALVHGLSRSERIVLAVSSLFEFSTLKGLVAQCKDYALALRGLAPDRASKLTFLAAFIKALFSAPEEKENVLPASRVPMLFMALYENDVLGEEDFREWLSAPPESDNWTLDRRTALESRAAAKAFLDWLDTAEEEE